MRFFPRNFLSRQDASRNGDIGEHGRPDDLTRRDRHAQYDRGNGISIASTQVAFNESDLVNGPVAASGTLTFTAGAIADDKLAVGSLNYVFAAALTDSAAAGSAAHPWQVKVSTNDAGSLKNLWQTVNSGDATGTICSAGAPVNARASANSYDATHVYFQAKSVGTGGNAVPTTHTAVGDDDGLAFGGTTLSGGYNALAITLSAQGFDRWDDSSVNSASFKSAFPTVIGSVLTWSCFSFSTNKQDLTVTFPANAAYSIAADASYDLSFAKECFRNANAAVAVSSAILVANGV